MSEMTAKATLPACPVETTLTLIGDKWKTGLSTVRSTPKYRREWSIR